WKEPHGVQEFNFKELAKATKNFAPERKIGEGSFGSVYMGRLPDGRVVAIKHRSRNSLQERLAGSPPARPNVVVVVIVTSDGVLEDTHGDTARCVAGHRVPAVLR
ncbi:hypothetical protein EE612_056962, partial [Oryza sativa]